jgi:serine/threonine protein kinase
MLAQGQYGCIFDPPLVCRGDKAPKGGWKRGKLGKLTEVTDIANEIMAAELFTNKPEAKKYFILPELDTLCQKGPDGQPAVILSQQREKEFDKCESLKRGGIADMLHYQMEYGGKTLQDRLENVQIAAKEFPFFKFMGHMLEIGAYLALNGLIHNDLHSGNIVVNKEYHPRLIDFGRAYYAKAITQETVDNLNAEYAPRLGQITPECSTQDGLIDKVPFPKIMQDLIAQKPGLLYAERLFGQSRQQQIAEFQRFWKTSKALQDGDYTKFWQLYWPVVDSWSIGHCLSSTLYKLSMSNQFAKAQEWKTKQSVVKAVITGLLKGSPRARLDCVEALALYDPTNAVLSSPSGKAWLQQKQEQREKMRGF